MKASFLLLQVFNLFVASFAFAVNPPKKNYLVETVLSNGKQVVKVWRFDAHPGVATLVTEVDQFLRSGESILKTVSLEKQGDVYVFISTSFGELYLVNQNQVKHVSSNIQDIAEYEDGVLSISTIENSVSRFFIGGTNNKLISSTSNFLGPFKVSADALFTGVAGHFSHITVVGKNEIVLLTEDKVLVKMKTDLDDTTNIDIKEMYTIYLDNVFKSEPGLVDASSKWSTVLELASGEDYVWVKLDVAFDSVRQAEFFLLGLDWSNSDADLMRINLHSDYKTLDVSRSGHQVFSIITGNYCTYSYRTQSFVVEKTKVYSRANLHSLGLTYIAKHSLHIDYPKHALDWYGRSKDVYNQAPFTGGLSPIAGAIPSVANTPPPGVPGFGANPGVINFSSIGSAVPVVEKPTVKQEYGNGKLGSYLGLTEEYKGIFQYEPMSEKAEQMMKQVFASEKHVPKVVKHDTDYFMELIKKEIPNLYSDQFTRSKFAQAVEHTTNLKYFFKDLFHADPQGNAGALSILGFKYENYGIKLIEGRADITVDKEEIRQIAQALYVGQLLENGKPKCEAELDSRAKNLIQKWIR